MTDSSEAKILVVYEWLMSGRHDIQHNDTQHNAIQHKNKWNATLSIMTLKAECCYAEGRLGSVSFMVCVANKPIMLNVIMLNVVMLTVVAPISELDTSCE